MDGVKRGKMHKRAFLAFKEVKRLACVRMNGVTAMLIRVHATKGRETFLWLCSSVNMFVFLQIPISHVHEKGMPFSTGP